MKRLRDKSQQLENRVAVIESSHDALEQYDRRNNLVISDIPDTVQGSDLESTPTSVLSDTDVNVESRCTTGRYRCTNPSRIPILSNTWYRCAIPSSHSA